ncbi:MAG: DUF1573 domain-containing protein [Planctomycetaceae bacterium]|nr:DUF1573 domain-containing protein [Planctomycetaceae bacterium]
MRITIILLVAAVAGTALGAGIAARSFYRFPEQSNLELGLVAPEKNLTEGFPSVEVDEKEYDFGAMDSHLTGKHAFVFRNVGKAPLKLEAGQTTCKCTLSDIGDGIIPPGESGEVTLEWHGRDFVGPFSQTATIKTNDPRNLLVDLKVHGEMIAKARLVPDSLLFTSATAGQAAHGSVTLFGYGDAPWKLTGYEVDEPEGVDVSYSPLSSDEVKQEAYAKFGYRIEVTTKPGLPLGPFKRRIRLLTSAEDPKELSLPVQGTISSEIAILGAGWHADQGMLRLGTLEGSKTVRKLLLRVGGLQPDQVQFEVAEVHPEFVVVRLGEPSSPPGSRVAVTPLEIEIPEGSPPCNFLGPNLERLGRIRLKTTHASVKELDIHLQFLIRG